MNPKALIALILSIILWVALIVALATPWFWIRDGDDDDYTIQYFKYNSINEVEYDDGIKDSDKTYSLGKSFKRANKNSIQIFNASLAFCVLAFVVTTIFIFCLILQLINKMPLGQIARFIPFIILFFCLISMFVFCGSANARKKDCERMNADDLSECESSIYDKFMGEEGETKWGGGVGFVFIIISSILSLASAIFVFFVGVFNNPDAPAQ